MPRNCLQNSKYSIDLVRNIFIIKKKFEIDIDNAGYLVHPLIPKFRVRYQRELDGKPSSTRISSLMNLFGEYEIVIGVCIYKKRNKKI
jgi:hypothetical protein